MDRKLMQEVEALYGLPPAEFVAARKARAKELKAEQPELAAQVAKLPKPTAAAAAINRVARDDPSEVRALVQAGRGLRSAQEAAVAGKEAGAVAGATKEHRAALERVRREARRLGLSDAVLEQVTTTLRAASVDPELQPLLERGLLDRDLETAGFALDPGLVPPAPQRPAPKRPAPKRPAAAPKKPAGPSAAARAAVKKAEARLTEAKRDLKTAEQEAARARKAVDTAERALAAARRRT